MVQRYVRPMNLGSLNSFRMTGPVPAPRVGSKAASQRLKALAEVNDQRFKDGRALFKEHLERTKLSAPVVDSWMKDRLIIEGVSNKWRHVRDPENYYGIKKYARFLAGVPHKVGIWMDREGNVTDLRFGHWGVHSLHIGSRIFTHAQAVAFLIPHEENYIPMEAYFFDKNPSVRTVVQAWFRNYVKPQGWYLDLDKHFKISPYITAAVNDHQVSNALRANTAHVHALSAPRLHIPDEKYRTLPGSVPVNEPDPYAISDQRPFGYLRFLRTIDGSRRELPKAVYAPVNVFPPKGTGRAAFFSTQRRSDNAMRLGVEMYHKKLERMGVAIPAYPDVLKPLMDAADRHWQGVDPATLDDIKGYVVFRAGVPFKVSMWWNATSDTILGMRLGHWGVHSLHLGNSLGEAGSVAYLMPSAVGYIPMRTQILNMHARNPVRAWMAKYANAHAYYEHLRFKYEIDAFREQQGKMHPGVIGLSRISDRTHMHEISTTLLGFGPEAHSSSLENLGSARTFIHGECGVWMFGVGEGNAEIGFEGQSYGAGVHSIEGGGELRDGSNRWKLSPSGGGTARIGSDWANLPWDHPY